MHGEQAVGVTQVHVTDERCVAQRPHAQTHHLRWQITQVEAPVAVGALARRLLGHTVAGAQAPAHHHVRVANGAATLSRFHHPVQVPQRAVRILRLERHRHGHHGGRRRSGQRRAPTCERPDTGANEKAEGGAHYTLKHNENG